MKAYRLIFLWALILMSFKISAQPHSNETELAFPGAEGYGKYTTGGRGGQVIKVTNLNDSGPGSLRQAVSEATVKRIVVFEVSGNIELQSPLYVNYGNITIAGQTAPGDGICIQNYPTIVNSNNVIIRYIRFRLGDLIQKEYDALSSFKQSNIIIDHCSISWGIDECGSFYRNNHFSLQWSIISESLNDSYHSKGPHGMGGIWGGAKASFHHNLLVHHNSRSPRFDGGRRSGYGNDLWPDTLDFRNNVIYNWGAASTYGGENGRYNMVNNYYKPGPASGPKIINRVTIDAFPDSLPPGYGTYYVKGNALHGNSNVFSNNWLAVNYTGTDTSIVRTNTPFPYEPIPEHSAYEAFQSVLNYAGASLSRDTLDKRVVKEAKFGISTFVGSKTGKFGIIDSQNDVGGWPLLTSLPAPVNTSGDGIPDSWKIQHGLNPALYQANDRNLSAVYDNIEVYINSLVKDISKNQYNYHETVVAHWNLTDNKQTTEAHQGIIGKEASLRKLTLSKNVSSFDLNRGMTIAPDTLGGSWLTDGASGANILPSRYIQFAIDIKEGFKANLQSILLNSAIISTGGGRMAIRYSSDSTFTSYQNITSSSLASQGTTLSIGTVESPVTLSSISTGNTHGNNSAWSFQLNGNEGVKLKGGTKFYFRIYYAANTNSSGKNATVRNVSVMGSIIKNAPKPPVLSNWPLIADNLPASSHVGVVVEQSSFSNLKLSTEITPFNVSRGMAFAPDSLGGSWQAGGASGTNILTDRYVQFKIKPKEGYTSNIKGIDFNSAITGTSYGRLAVRWSLDSTFTTFNDVTSSYLESEMDTVEGRGTVINPDVLLSSSNTLSEGTKWTYKLNGFEGKRITFDSTIYIRLYYAAGTTSSSKYATLRNVSIFGDIDSIIPPPVIAKWSLSSDKESTLQHEGINAQQLGLNNLVLATNHQTFNVNRGMTFAPDSLGGSWQTGGASGYNILTTRYVELKISPESGYSANARTIDFYSCIMSSSGGRLAIRYSRDSTFSVYNEVSSSYLASETFYIKDRGTVDNPVYLASIGNGYTLADNTKWSFKFNNDFGEYLVEGDTLYVRIYYTVNTSSTAKNANLRDITIRGIVDSTSMLESHHKETLLVSPVTKQINRYSDSIKTYPNPFSNELNVNIGDEKYYKIVLMNTSGQVVYEQSLNGTIDKLKIDLSYLPIGVYNIVLFNDTGKKVSKIIKL